MIIGMGANWAESAPEKVTDWGWRGLHGSVVFGKQLIKEYYGKVPSHSYYRGCSTGGRQGLKEAQMFPDDFDGIIAGAPANYRTHLQIGHIWTASATLKDPASFIPPSKYPIIHKAVL